MCLRAGDSAPWGHPYVAPQQAAAPSGPFMRRRKNVRQELTPLPHSASRRRGADRRAARQAQLGDAVHPKAENDQRRGALLCLPILRPEGEAEPDRNERKRLSLALQGGGAFGAFTWGVLDRLLEEDDIAFDAVSGASAGAINAVLLASGLAKGGPDEARASLERFWRSVGDSAAKNLFLHPELVVPPRAQLSPYQFNPLELNPLRDLLAAEVDFEAVRTRSPVRLLVSATRVQRRGASGCSAPRRSAWTWCSPRRACRGFIMP